MTYSKYLSLDDVLTKFQLKFRRGSFFQDCRPVPVSDYFKTVLEDAKSFGLNTEKARSERIVWPFLRELSILNAKKIAIYSGYFLNADPKNGLSGECDFLLSYDTAPEVLQSPLFSVVEAKKQDLDYGMAQCTAQMLGAQIFNRQRNSSVKKVYGAATSGEIWRFLSLEKDQLVLESETFYLDSPGQLLGFMQCIFDEFKKENNIQ